MHSHFEMESKKSWNCIVELKGYITSNGLSALTQQVDILLKDDLLYFWEFTITQLLYCTVILLSVWTMLAGLFD